MEHSGASPVQWDSWCWYIHRQDKALEWDREEKEILLSIVFAILSRLFCAIGLEFFFFVLFKAPLSDEL